MPDDIVLKDARELALRAEARIPPSEDMALSLPIPMGPRVPLCIAFFAYEEGAQEGLELVYPASFLVRLDPRSGQVIEARPWTPRELGLDLDPEEPTLGFGLPEDLSGEAYWAENDRLMELSARVWAAWASGIAASSQGIREQAREVDRLFKRVALAPHRSTYAAMGADFLAWLKLA